ncbi:hypothetical protein PybrP1_009271, partial [[Pythium] brassicae (nom. inval.)]
MSCLSQELLKRLNDDIRVNATAVNESKEAVFCGKAPSWNLLREIAPFNAGLNASQLEAIRFALASKDLAPIHGPLGTGKTTTVVELLLQAVNTTGMRVLVCAPSNIAMDNVLEKLSRTDRALRPTRVRRPALLLPQVLRHCLEAKILAADGTEIVNGIREEMVAMQMQLSKTRDKGARFALRRNLKTNRKEVRQREHLVMAELAKRSDVAFLSADAFVPRTASDVWQFGCLLLIDRLAPWSKIIGDKQILHLFSAVTDSALAVIINEVESQCLRPILQRTLVLNLSHRWDIDRLNTPGLSVAASDGAAASLAYEFLHSTLQQHAEGLLVAEEHHRAAKHAQDQLDFMRKEQALLRRDLVATRSHLREAEEEAEQLQAQLASVTHQCEEAKLKVQVFAHNHQSMTHQLQTTGQMLLNLVPLARKAAGFETELAAGFPLPPLSRCRISAVQIVKSRLQNSRFAYGCVKEKGDVSEDFDLPRPREKR